ncbi:MAG: DNA-directed RNA polymerase subunit omega [Coriobacteriia bacterium]|nr:DNA-directed RNA polymerase subunit omega [Coriobacteriia bacterium]
MDNIELNQEDKTKTKKTLMEPAVDDLLSKADNDRFLLCAVASERARDINDMMRGQRDRALALQSASQIAQYAGRKPLSLAMEEIARGEVGYDQQKFEEAIS